MIHSNSILNAVLAKLTVKELEDLLVIKEFPSVRRDNPLSSATISVGAESVTVEKDSEKNRITDEYSQMIVKVRLTLCVPKALGGDVCYNILDRVIAALKPLVSEYKVLEIESKELKYSTALKSLVMPITITVSAGNVYES